MPPSSLESQRLEGRAITTGRWMKIYRFCLWSNTMLTYFAALYFLPVAGLALIWVIRRQTE